MRKTKPVKSDQELLKQAIHYGRNALEWRRKFVGLLPEISRRHLYRKKGCISIFEFAAKFGGVSRDQVKLALSLSKSFEDRPLLKNLLESGEVSPNKLVRVRRVATSENEAYWSEQVQSMSTRTIEAMVRDEKSAPQILHVQNLDLTNEIKTRLVSLQNSGINLSELLCKLLDQHEAEKTRIGEMAKETNSRYIPVKVREILNREYGDQCAMPQCHRSSKEIDHIVPFSMIKRHDPRLMRPLCKAHHQIAHAIDRRVVERRLEIMRC